MDLQERNSKSRLYISELIEEGFVTLRHSRALLSKMNSPFPHIIAKKNDNLIGYALVLLTNLKNEIPGLDNMFNELDNISFQNKKLNDYKFFIMGQVCVSKSYRKKGVFRALYEHMAFCMKKNFDLIITEIDEKNQRSLNAHIGIGFEIIRKYTWKNGEMWNIVALKIR